jgi:hypothetical protein
MLREKVDESNILEVSGKASSQNTEQDLNKLKVTLEGHGKSIFTLQVSEADDPIAIVTEFAQKHKLSAKEKERI